MSMWASVMNLGYGVLPSIIGELVWISPIVMFVVSITALGIDPNMEEAAKDLGTDTVTMYRKILLPLLSDGIVSGAIFAFVPRGTTTTSSRTSRAPRARSRRGSTAG